MEIVFHRRRRNLFRERELLFCKMKNEKCRAFFFLDHIVPFCISQDDSIENLQLLRKKIHDIKSGKDRKILNKFKKQGWIETISQYCMRLNKPKVFLKNKFLEERDNEEG